METKNLKKWTEYLEEVVGCQPIVDEEFPSITARPCDLGMPCDFCIQMDMKIPFEQWRRGQIDKEGNKIK